MKNDLISRKAMLTVPNVRKVTEFDETGEGITYLAVPVDEIEKAPAIEAEPVRQGEWNVIEINRARGTIAIECPECEAVFERSLFEYGLNCNFCQNCGAKMDGGKKDG